MNKLFKVKAHDPARQGLMLLSIYGISTGKPDAEQDLIRHLIW